MDMTARSTTGTARAVRRFAGPCLAIALAACVARGTGEIAVRQPEAPRTEPAVAAVPPQPPVAPEPPAPPPRLMGLGHAEVVDILGQPAFQRHDAPALLLRYRGEACILDLFLYPSASADAAGSPTVEHVEARTTDGHSTVTSDCVAAVMKAKATARAG